MARRATAPGGLAAAAAAEEARIRRRLVTPEGVDLGLTLASRGQRMAAFLLDFLFMLLFLIAMTIAIALLAIGGPSGSGALMASIWLLGFFLLRNFYFTIMEMGPRAATFGKRLTGIRVVARSGARLTADAVIARNLMREIEVYLPLSFLGFSAAEGTASTLASLLGLGWACLFLFFPCFNKDRLRVGDLLAGTWVINVPKRQLGLDLLREFAVGRYYTFTDEQLDAYGAFELQTLEKVLRDADPNALATVSATIRAKIDYGEVGDDYAFLSLYYQSLRGRLERKLLFGKRRLDKHDR
jgi:uncharacterized RDD family membrane protein YckC